MSPGSDPRQKLLLAGIAILREEGFAGFTQPRVAAKAGVRQSHLTYYFPTRADLLAGVGQMAIAGQLAAIDAAFLKVKASGDFAVIMAEVVIQNASGRVMIALAQAADQEPALRALFNELTAGIVERCLALLGRLKLRAESADADLIHAACVGLAVIGLATNRPAGRERSQAVLERLFESFASKRRSAAK